MNCAVLLFIFTHARCYNTWQTSAKVSTRFVCHEYYNKHFKMEHFKSLLLLITTVLCLENVQAYFISIDAHAEECFFDKVSSGTKMSLMFEVAEGGFLDIDVKVLIIVLCLLHLSKRYPF